MSSAYYGATHTTSIQIDPIEFETKNASDVDETTGGDLAELTGDVNLILQNHRYEVVAGEFYAGTGDKLLDLAARTSHDLALGGASESLIWHQSESVLRGRTTFNGAVSYVAQNNFLPALVTAEYYFDLTGYASQIIDIRPNERPLYRLEDRLKFTASSSGLVGDPIDYDRKFYDIHANVPPDPDSYSVLKDDVNSGCQVGPSVPERRDI